jgi:cobalt/nickel transport system permease protein
MDPASVIPATRKLLSAFIFSICVSLLGNIAAACAACLVSLLLILLFRLPWRRLLKILLPVNFFFLFLWIMLPLSIFAPGSGQEPGFASGQAVLLFNLGPFYFYQSGLLLAALITLKGNAIAAMLLALAGTSGISENCRALRRLHVPEKLVMLLLITHSNLGLLAQEAKVIRQAAKLRGFTPRTSPSGYRTLAWLVGLLLVRAWQRAKRVEEAMLLRGFNGRFPLLHLDGAKDIPATGVAGGTGGDSFANRRGDLLLAGLALCSLLILFGDLVIL